MTIATLGAAAAGCGSDDSPEGPDIGGIYQVTHHTRGVDSCDVEGADVTEPPYFRLERRSLFGFPYYGFDACTEPVPETCTTGTFGSVEIAEHDGWRGELFASSPSGDTGCWLIAVFTSAKPMGDGIRLESRSYQADDPELSGDACNPDVAQARGRSMPCSDFEVYEGALVQ